MGKGVGVAALCIPFLVEIGRERCAVRCGMAMGMGGRGASECIPFLVLAIGSAVSGIACAPGPALRMAFKANSSTGESSVSCTSNFIPSAAGSWGSPRRCRSPGGSLITREKHRPKRSEKQKARVAASRDLPVCRKTSYCWSREEMEAAEEEMRRGEPPDAYGLQISQLGVGLRRLPGLNSKLGAAQRLRCAVFE